MAVTNFFANKIATELLKMLITISRKSMFCKNNAEELITSIEELQPIIHEIKYIGTELLAARQRQIDTLSETLRNGLELAGKVLNSDCRNMYKNLQLERKMEKLEKNVSSPNNPPWIKRQLQLQDSTWGEEWRRKHVSSRSTGVPIVL
ncbi:unnamed protein product [Ilex paraguariensis]|uniref:RPW8 domain-containing protein n=1 Tax=Ilex paraguariensis TaxID=185542 RepID=A0ABC8UDK6_9AQUA